MKIDDFAGIMEFAWQWSSEMYPENVRILAPQELSEKDYYSRFMEGLWGLPDVTEEELALAARESRTEFEETQKNR